MLLDRRRCRRANEARDRRFDGLFFCGVVTTGIYCRPICPVRLPKAENVDYYPSAAACEEAGFRPCRRCRPETAPGTPAWAGSSTTVRRALRVIEDRAPEVLAVDELGAQLGVGSRHLRRLFAQHLGASPLSVMRTRRAHFARRLIDETQLPMAEVALASGFTSVRQFNQSIRETFDRSPSELRRLLAPGRGKPSAQACAGEIAVHLPYRPPLDWAGLLAFLAPRATAGVEVVGSDAYRRVIDVPGGLGVAEVRQGKSESALQLRLWVADSSVLAFCVERAKRLFDLDANPVRIGEDLGRDPLLRRALEAAPGIRVPGAWDPFELGVRAILGQQVSVRGATTLSGRLAATFGKPLEMSGFEGLTHAFPRPEALAEGDIESIGMPRTRAEAIRGLARRVADGTLQLAAVGDPEDVVAALLEVPGIGDWTAQYIAMRALGDSDAFPASDLGLLKAASDDTGRPTPAALAKRAEAWRPWRAYAALCLWSQLGASQG